MALEGNPHSAPASPPVELADNDPPAPVQAWFRVWAIGLGWGPTTPQVLIYAHPMAEDDAALPLKADAAPLPVRMPVGASRA
ncbi:DUF3090 family protein, partial [Micrococcus sp. SIMBA_144]